jgi:hypothetical protein
MRTQLLALLDESVPRAMLALLSTTPRREVAAYVAVVITLMGVRLCWRAPRYRMSIEERAKDGVLTEEEARRKIAFVQWFGPAVVTAGCATLAIILLE